MSVFRPGNLALITGGASGIGLAVVQLCLKHGMRVAVVDNDAKALALAKQSLSGNGTLETYEADVSKEEAWQSLKHKVQEKFELGEDGAPDLLMLNAGIQVPGTWGDSEYFQKAFATNLMGVVNGINTFLPTIKSRNTPSAIVVSGSKQGITNPPGNPAYNASKAAVKALAEHLSWDLRDTQTNVHLLVPGWTFTGLTGCVPGGSAKKPPGAWETFQVASYLYEKMLDDKFYIICPDNDVSETTDKKRMLWSVGDMVNGRPPLTRWRPEFQEEAQKWMDSCEVD